LNTTHYRFSREIRRKPESVDKATNSPPRQLSVCATLIRELIGAGLKHGALTTTGEKARTRRAEWSANLQSYCASAQMASAMQLMLLSRPCKIHQHRANDGDMSEGDARVARLGDSESPVPWRHGACLAAEPCEHGRQDENEPRQAQAGHGRNSQRML